jgi:protein pelota
LLITDSLFRSHDFRARKKFIKLVDDAKRNGVKVHIFSDLHPSGQKLKEITGKLA